MAVNQSSQSALDRSMTYALAKTKSNLETLKAFPHTTESGKWLQSNHGRWTAGFWVGMLWLGYAYTGDPLWSHAAKDWERRLVSRKYDRSTHDMGFLFQPSFVRGWALTGEDDQKTIALTACSSHASRYNPAGHFIPAWDSSEDPKYMGRAIVDTSMNLPILYWGANHGGDPAWADTAARVSETIRRHHIRDDGSTRHVVDFDPVKGMAVNYTTHQGYAADSCWSRGQAWALYGFAQLFQWSQCEDDKSAAIRLADYLIEHLPEDGIPYWDFQAPLIPDEPKDTAAAAISASGLLELDYVLGGGTKYRTVALRILDVLANQFLSVDAKDEQEGILLGGAVDVPRQSAMNESIIYGDHYFMEAMCKVLKPQLHEVILGVRTA